MQVRIKQETYFISIRWWFVKLCLVLPLYGYAQLRQEKRLEIPISFENDKFEIAAGKENGLILYRRGKDQIEFVQTDTALQEQWRGSLPVENNLYLYKQASFKNFLYFIFCKTSRADFNFHLYQIDIKTGDYKRFIVMNSIPFLPISLEATSIGSLIGGYYNRVPVVIFFDFISQKAKVLPGLYNEAGELDQIKVNENETFDLLINSRNFNNQQTIWVKNYDPTGKLIRNVMLEPEGKNHLIFGRTIQTKNNNQIIAGVYGSRNGEVSRGLFIAQLSHDGLQRIQYYNFSDLENFFKYMKPRQEQRVKNRIERKKMKGKKTNFHYSFIVHEFVPYKNQFVLLGEAFLKQYKSLSSGAFMPTPTNTPRIFDGYRYTHAAILGIDPKGNLLWDNSFEINDVKTFTLEQFVKIDTQQDKIALLYLYDNKIRTKIIQDSTVLEGKSTNPVLLQSSDVLSLDETGGNINKLDYWYGNYFLAYGVQSLETPSGFKRRKKVFFVNKVRYH